jgi:hypothetical protein
LIDDENIVVWYNNYMEQPEQSERIKSFQEKIRKLQEEEGVLITAILHYTEQGVFPRFKLVEIKKKEEDAKIVQ